MKDITTAILTEIINIADSLQVEPIFVYLPIKEEVFNTDTLVTGGKILIFDI
jgi:hypothetical protein